MKKAIGGLLALSLLLTACAIRQETVGEENGYLLYFLAETDEARGGDLIRSSYERLPIAKDAPLEEQAAALTAPPLITR